MIKLIKDNKTKLGISTEDARFDSSIAITKRTLRNNTLDLTITLDSLTLDTAFVKVHLLNKAGHKFPTGYPSRRGVLQLVAIGNLTDTIFQSGIFDSNYEVKYLDPIFEPHYNVINDTTQTQIYEMIMADVNLNKTTVLERADTLLKDNRLVPEGFSTSALQYDTIPIVGDAVTDVNFNHYPGGAEGSGTDNIYYHIAVTGYSNAIKVYAKMYYQPVPPGWLQELFSYSSAPIDSFRNMYNAANKSPNLVACDSLNNFVVGLKSNQLYNQLVISPDPTSDGYFSISFPNTEKVDKVQILSMNGQLISQQKVAIISTLVQAQLPENKGVYFVRIHFLNGQVVTKKVIRL